MTLSEAAALFSYWQESPPAGEMLAMLAGIYTTWRPAGAAKQTAGDETLPPSDLPEFEP